VRRYALLLLPRRRRLRALRLEVLRREIQKEIDSGPPLPAGEVFARLRAKLATTATDAEA
jgi:hypothetical protein